MKKIIILTISLFILTSCNTETKIEKEVISDKNIENKIIEENIENEIIEGNSEEFSLDKNIKSEKQDISSDLEGNIPKLKDIDFNNEDLNTGNEQIPGVYNDSIEKKAIKNNDISVCEKLNGLDVENCKKQVFIESEKIDSCDNLSNKYESDFCKNQINSNLAIKNSDESVCEKIIDESEEKYEINSCKDTVISNKAVANMDSNICKKINDKNQIGMCEELVKLEEDNKRIEEEIKKEENTVFEEEALVLEEDNTVNEEEVPVVEEEVTTNEEEVTVIEEETTTNEEEVLVLEEDNTVVEEEIPVIEEEATQGGVTDGFMFVD